MTRFSGRFLATVAVVALIAITQVAVAQQGEGQRRRGGPGGFGGGGGGFGGFLSTGRLASIDKVQEVLKLSDEQKAKIKTISAESREEMNKLREGNERPDPDTMRDKMRKMTESTNEKVNKVLDEGQQKRLLGIFIQLAGAAGAVRDAAVAKELNLTDDQKQKLKDMMPGPPGGRRGGEGTQGREGRPGGREGRGGGGQSFADMRARMDKEVLAVLTSEQQKKLESLKGEKVDIDMSALFRGPGSGRPGQGGERRNRANRGADQPEEKKAA